MSNTPEDKIKEELDNLARMNSWHRGECRGHMHHPTCPVVMLRGMISTLIEDTKKEERERNIKIIKDTPNASRDEVQNEKVISEYDLINSLNNNE